MLTPRPGADATLFQALIEHSTDAIVVVDDAGVVRFANRSMERVLGYTPEERVGTNGFEIVHPDDSAAARQTLAECVTAAGTSVYTEVRVRHQDGSWRLVEAVATNLTTEPAIRGIVVTFRDVTARRRSEEAERLRRSEAQYRSLIQGAEYAIFRTSLDGAILDGNPAFVTMLGYGSIDELKQRNIASVYASGADREAMLQRFRREGRTRMSGLVEWRRRDGSPITVRLSGRLVDFEEDGVSGFEAIAEDVTARRALEQQLRQAQKMEAVGRLARGIAHDFNNLLAAIMGCADLIQARLGQADPSLVDASEIGRAAERGASLTRQLLAFSRRQSATPQPLDVHGTIRGFDRMLQQLAGDVGIRVHTPGPPPIVLAEPGQIEQVLMNLVVNARDATLEGGSIDLIADIIAVEPKDAARYPHIPPGRFARIIVKDTGVGIDPKVHRHVFEPFYSTKDPATGGGLGLSIVYGIARDAGGTVVFTSAPGEGTTFEVLLPIARQESRISPS
jgi:two-component system, cell cycle sensor histidine kinase and response regulator CckA